MQRRLASECCEERADVDSVLVGVTEGEIGSDLIAIPPSDTLARHIASVDEVVYQNLDRPLGDSDPLHDHAQADLRVVGDAEKRTGVIREECPAHPGVALVVALSLDRLQVGADPCPPQTLADPGRHAIVEKPQLESAEAPMGIHEPAFRLPGVAVPLAGAREVG
jgi:hypothetical protein